MLAQKRDMFETKEQDRDVRALLAYGDLVDTIKKIVLKLKALRLLSDGTIPNSPQKNESHITLILILGIIQRSSASEIKNHMHSLKIKCLFKM